MTVLPACGERVGKLFRLAVPTRVHPLVSKLFRIMRHEMMSVAVMAERTGVDRKTILNWRYRSNPRLLDFAACLNAIGYELVIRQVSDAFRDEGEGA